LVCRLSEMGKQVGLKVVDLIILREKNYKREVKLLHILLFIRSVVWKVSAYQSYILALISRCQYVRLRLWFIVLFWCSVVMKTKYRYIICDSLSLCTLRYTVFNRSPVISNVQQKYFRSTNYSEAVLIYFDTLTQGTNMRE